MTDFVQEARRLPQVDALGFDHRLMTAERLLESAGKWPLIIGTMGGLTETLDCRHCGRAVEHLVSANGSVYTIEPMQLLSNVLRHMVMRHDYPLSGGGNAGRN